MKPTLQSLRFEALLSQRLSGLLSPTAEFHAAIGSAQATLMAVRLLAPPRHSPIGAEVHRPLVFQAKAQQPARHRPLARTSRDWAVRRFGDGGRGPNPT